jgi:hypothetical protein
VKVHRIIAKNGSDTVYFTRIGMPDTDGVEYLLEIHENVRNRVLFVGLDRDGAKELAEAVLETLKEKKPSPSRRMGPR